MIASEYELALDGYVDFGNEDCHMRVGDLQGKITVRCKADATLVASLSETIRCAWDTGVCRWSADKSERVMCLWMGPDERRILCDFEEVDSLCQRLENISSKQTVASTNVSSQFEAIVLEGRMVREILSAVIPLDVAEESFPDQSVAGTLCAKVRISLMRKGEAYFVFARRSEMYYIWRMFENLMRSAYTF